MINVSKYSYDKAVVVAVANLQHFLTIVAVSDIIHTLYRLMLISNGVKLHDVLIDFMLCFYCMYKVTNKIVCKCANIVF